MHSTLRSIISALLICVSGWAGAQAGKPLELAPDAPDRHVVVPGDTLWGIAKLFLKDPFRWPEIWRMNTDEIRNPHWIYPGQVVVLDSSGAEPRLRLASGAGGTVKAEPRIYVESAQRAIPSIPPGAIEPFLSRPLVIEAGAFDNAARIVALPDARTVVGAGDAVYATGIAGAGSLWQVFRPGQVLRDPDRPEDVLGIEAVYLGNAQLVTPGDPAKLAITAAKEEIGRNDYLVPSPGAAMINYAPHAPVQPVRGRVLALYGSVGEGGRLSIVSISRGRADGLELGHVLMLHKTGVAVENRFNGKLERYRLPDERYGSVFVFRVFDRVSYALVMDASRGVVAGDFVTAP